MAEVIVNTLAWRNIPTDMMAAQRAVFKKMDIPLRQFLDDRRDHGGWMDSLIADAGPDDLIIFCDVDALPLTRGAFELAIRHAEAGAVFGVAQSANHLGHAEHIYAAPM